MSDDSPLDRNQELEKYLDDLMSPAERGEFERLLKNDSELRSQVERQEQIDASLRRLYAVPETRPDLDSAKTAVRDSLSATQATTSRRTRWTATRVTLLATAASLAWLAVAWQFLATTDEEIRFVSVPLTEIYQKSVAQGFQPYWLCEDDRQFASVFSHRQGQGLLLKKMPAGTHMEGLAYLGGISRNTTTMLARVDQQPVLVFVDRLDEDSPQPQPNAASGLNLFRKELGDLVIYELTPHATPSVMKFLFPAAVPTG